MKILIFYFLSYENVIFCNFTVFYLNYSSNLQKGTGYWSPSTIYCNNFCLSCIECRSRYNISCLQALLNVIFTRSFSFIISLLENFSTNRDIWIENTARIIIVLKVWNMWLYIVEVWPFLTEINSTIKNK